MSGLFHSLWRWSCPIVVLFAGCRGGNALSNSAAQAAAPTITTTAARNGAVIVSLASPTRGATVYYTLDGSTPTSSSQMYQAPFLVAANLTVNAIATTSGDTPSSVVRRKFTLNIPSGTIVWSDEFANSTGANTRPNPSVWTYDTGNSGFGNHERENYCAWGSAVSPCSTTHPNAYVGTDGYLHIVAQQPSTGVYTSARLKTQGLFSFQYGRFEVRARGSNERRSTLRVFARSIHA